MAKANNKNLNKSKKDKDDEFYTQLVDIENEVKHYWDYFKGKVVYLNCDNPEHSNFWVYFSQNFEYLGLKKLIAIHYEPRTLVNVIDPDFKPPYKREMVEAGIFIDTSLRGDGDFQKSECIEILKGVDIVVTNPPFSLFRNFIEQLIEYDKEFLVIGNFLSITYKNMIEFYKDSQIWTGVSRRSMGFYKGDGIQTVNACWFTNLDHHKRHKKISNLYKTYKGNESKYPKYDNFDAINCDLVVDIPVDYTGYIGVPVTILDKFCHEQFELIGIDRYIDGNLTPNKRFSLNGTELPPRLVIKHI